MKQALEPAYLLGFSRNRGENVTFSGTSLQSSHMYAAAPVSAVLYKCRITETDIPCDYSRGVLTIKALMKIQLLKRYKPSRFTFERLRDEYGIFAVRGPRGIPHSLSQALKK